jgi:hypothetical protein
MGKGEEITMHGNIGSEARVRIVRRDDTWTFQETEVVRKHWPNVEKIRALLPHRSSSAIRRIAQLCGLKSDHDMHVWTAAEQAKLRKMAAAGASRKEIATELNLSVSQVGSRLTYTRLKIAPKPPAPSDNPLVDAIRQRVHAVNMTLIDLDRSLGSRKIFSQSAGRQRVSPVHIHRAARALGGRLVIEWPAEQ